MSEGLVGLVHDLYNRVCVHFYFQLKSPFLILPLSTSVNSLKITSLFSTSKKALIKFIVLIQARNYDTQFDTRLIPMLKQLRHELALKY